jgi:hypothetical protein
VGRDGVFQRQFVQAEFLTQPGDRLAVGCFHLDPDETIGMRNMVADVVKFDRLDLGVVEKQAVDGGLRWQGNEDAVILAGLHFR